MNLYIKIVDGQPIEHPITEENLLHAFPHIQLPNLPPGYARFERVQLHEANLTLDTFEKPINTYAWVGGVVKDVWGAAPMNEVERERKTQDVIFKKEDLRKYKIAAYEAGLSQDMIPEFRQAVEEHIAELRAYVVADAPFEPLPKPRFYLKFKKNEDGTITLKE